MCMTETLNVSDIDIKLIKYRASISVSVINLGGLAGFAWFQDNYNLPQPANSIIPDYRSHSNFNMQHILVIIYNIPWLYCGLDSSTTPGASTVVGWVPSGPVVARVWCIAMLL